MTVAHRINTIINYDYIVVLDGGRVSEKNAVSGFLC